MREARVHSMPGREALAILGLIKIA